VVFEIGETCKNIYIIMTGMISIYISDNVGNEEHLDILGRGSILGTDFTLIKELWVYRAINHTSVAAKLFIIPETAIFKLQNEFPEIDDAVK